MCFHELKITTELRILLMGFVMVMNDLIFLLNTDSFYPRVELLVCLRQLAHLGRCLWIQFLIIVDELNSC